MYVTRRLSEYKKNPSEMTVAPPEGPNSGILVIQDEESQPTCCFGLCFDDELRGFPFPQNTKLSVCYTTTRNSASGHTTTDVDRDPVVFIPVLDQPLSSNRYYAIKRRGKHSGEASVSGKEEDRVTCCLCFSWVPETKPQPPDPYDIYQQFEIQQRGSSTRRYLAKSVAPDGVPPRFLKRKGWTVKYSTSENFGLRDDAKGLDTALRSKLPDLNSNVVIGKWYVPFIFVKEGNVKDQMKRSMYYVMTLEQKWEQIFSTENIYNEDREVTVDVDLETEIIKVDGTRVASETRNMDGDGVVWFRATTGNEGQDKKIGLGSAVVERMILEEQKFGWTSGRGQTVRVQRAEKFAGGRDWKSYGCYVFVERFVLRRIDGSLVLTYEFRHVDKLRSKWD